MMENRFKGNGVLSLRAMKSLDRSLWVNSPFGLWPHGLLTPSPFGLEEWLLNILIIIKKSEKSTVKHSTVLFRWRTSIVIHKNFLWPPSDFLYFFTDLYPARGARYRRLTDEETIRRLVAASPSCLIRLKSLFMRCRWSISVSGVHYLRLIFFIQF